MPKTRMVNTFDFKDYKPINDKQREFHASQARNKLLIGGVGAGKTMPAIHESFFVAHANPGHKFYVWKNTWDAVKELESEMVQVSSICNCHKKFDRQEHTLWLHNNCQMIFRPLTIGIEQVKGWNMCGFYCDDPNVDRFKKMIGFLFTRLRNTATAIANYFETIITSNWEGKNWVWQTWMRKRAPGGDDKFAYWLIKTEENPTLPEDFIPNLAETHSQTWMDRYVYCDMSMAFVGLVYPEYDEEFHLKPLKNVIKKKRDMMKILVIDIGMNAATVVLHMATDFKNIYVYNEWYKRDFRMPDLGDYLIKCLKEEEIKDIVIDPSSARRDPTSGKSVRNELRRDFGIRTIPAIKHIHLGIENIKNLLTIRNGQARIYFDINNTPNCQREIEIYKWKSTQNSEFEEFMYKEEPIDTDNDCMDCVRYGGMYFKNKIRIFTDREKFILERRNRELMDKINKLPFYKEHPNLVNLRNNAVLLDKLHKNKTSNRDKILGKRRTLTI